MSGITIQKLDIMWKKVNAIALLHFVVKWKN